jgi:hypothetical protein
MRIAKESPVSGVFSMAPEVTELFSAANLGAAETISAAGTVHHDAHVAAAVAALGPIGGLFLAAYEPAQLNTLLGTLQVAALHAAVAGATDAFGAATIAADMA